MVDFLDGRLQDVWLDQLFPMLGHNDLLRLRSLCSQTKELATRYIWTPGNHRSWELRLYNPIELDDLALKKLLPPSRLCISPPNFEPSIFESELFTEFMNTYGKFITHLAITDITIPVISAKEIQFYAGLTNLKSLRIRELHFGGMTDESCLFPAGFRNLKTLQVDNTRDLSLTWRFINGMGENLESLSLQYSAFPLRVRYRTDYDHLPRQFIASQEKMKYFDYGNTMLNFSALECLRLFEICFRKNIKMRNVSARALEVILVDVESGNINQTRVLDPTTGELVYGVNYQRNMFIGNVIQSLRNLSYFVFLTEMLHLEELEIDSFYNSTFRIWRRHGYPIWPNLKKLTLKSDCGVEEIAGMAMSILQFILRQDARPNLEELEIRYFGFEPNRSLRVNPMDIVRSCGNLKKLTLIDCGFNDQFFVALWEGLPMLETVNLTSCLNLGTNGFIGNEGHEGRPVFMNLQRLKHLKIGNVGGMRINDDLFRLVIRNIRLASLELSSSEVKPCHQITTQGIKTLLTGEFAESIERFDLGELKLHGVSAEEIKELQSLFRSSRMI